LGNSVVFLHPSSIIESIDNEMETEFAGEHNKEEVRMKRSLMLGWLGVFTLMLLVGCGASAQPVLLHGSGEISGIVYQHYRYSDALPSDTVLMRAVVVLNDSNQVAAWGAGSCCPPQPGCPCDSTSDNDVTKRMLWTGMDYAYEYAIASIPFGRYRVALVAASAYACSTGFPAGSYYVLAYAKTVRKFKSNQAMQIDTRFISVTPLKRKHAGVDIFYTE